MPKERYFILFDLYVEGFNFHPSNLVYGHPGFPATYGFLHNFERLYNKPDKEDEEKIKLLNNFTISTVKQNNNIENYPNSKSFSQQRGVNNQIDAEIKKKKSNALTTKAKSDGHFKILVEVKSNLGEKIDFNISKMRFAGGLITNKSKIMIKKIIETEDEEKRERQEQSVINSLMPGSIIIDRHEKVEKIAKEYEWDQLDALLYCISYKTKFSEIILKIAKKNKNMELISFLSEIYNEYISKRFKEDKKKTRQKTLKEILKKEKFKEVLTNEDLKKWSKKISNIKKESTLKKLENFYAKRVEEKGFYLPIFIGYENIYKQEQRLSCQQHPEYDHLYVEPVITLGEAVLPIRFNTIDDIMWQQTHEGNYFIFTQTSNLGNQEKKNA
jgi:CRISPR type I-F-associated protein Csy2